MHHCRKLVLWLVLTTTAAMLQAEPADNGWRSLFDGKTLRGWHKQGGGLWSVRDGIIIGKQEPTLKGGFLVTDEKFSDVEVEVATNPVWSMDTGLFLRLQPNVHSYQVTIDYRPGGEVGGIYSPGGGGWLKHQPNWRDFYKKDEWNKIRARIVGQPPRIQVWINDKAVMDWTDDKERVPASGSIGLQVHGGQKLGDEVETRFRNIRVRPLTGTPDKP